MNSTSLLSEKPIDFGRTAEIFAWGNGKVLKLFYDWIPADDVQYEAAIASAIQSSGLRVPEVGEIVEVDGRLGLEYEKLEGIPMLEEMRLRPWRSRKYASFLAELQAEIHALSSIRGIPTLRDKIEKRIRCAGELSSKTRERALSLVEVLPQDAKLCHGDFHPGNVFLTQQGPIVIDWVDASLGNPSADVARTSIVIMGELAIEGQTTYLEKVFLNYVHRRYLQRYFQLRPQEAEVYCHWLPLVAAARLSEGVEELSPWLIAKSEEVLSLSTE